MQIFRLMLVESSLVVSVSTDSLQMAPSYSDDVNSFTINYLRIIGAFTFLDFVQSRLTRVDFSFSLHAMTLKIYLLIC